MAHARTARCLAQVYVQTRQTSASPAGPRPQWDVSGHSRSCSRPQSEKKKELIAMTIRNAIPTFGMRSVVALVVLAVAALAALLAVGSPASAQSLTGTEIWSATLTAESQATWRGYWSTDPVNIGSLTDDEFTAPAGDTRKVQILSHGSLAAFGSVTSQATIYFSAGPRRAVAEIFNDNELKSMTLHVDGYEFEFEDASTTYDSSVGTAYTWPRPSGMSQLDKRADACRLDHRCAGHHHRGGHNHGGIRRK